jgi:hypothetical protein
MSVLVEAVMRVTRMVKLRMRDSQHASNALRESGQTKIGLAASHAVATRILSLGLNVSSAVCRMWWMQRGRYVFPVLRDMVQTQVMTNGWTGVSVLTV